MEIEIQCPDVSLGEIQEFAARFSCKAFKTKTRFHYRIESDDPINFFWLGCNMNNGLLNQLMPSVISKYVEL